MHYNQLVIGHNRDLDGKHFSEAEDSIVLHLKTHQGCHKKPSKNVMKGPKFVKESHNNGWLFLEDRYLTTSNPMGAPKKSDESPSNMLSDEHMDRGGEGQKSQLQKC